MSTPSDNSFIPKRGSKKSRHKVNVRQVYAFTFVSYTFLFATLIASAGAFFYQESVQNDLTQEVIKLTAEIDDFNEVDMQRVIEFDRRLSQASGRLDASTSIVGVLEMLEEATVSNVSITNLSIERFEDVSLEVTAQIETESFDATLFQRGIYNRSPRIGKIEITNLGASNLDTELATGVNTQLPTVAFSASFEVPLEDVAYSPSDQPVQEVFVPEPVIVDDTDVVEQGDSVDEPTDDENELEVSEDADNNDSI
jgi:hypothetical protein